MSTLQAILTGVGAWWGGILIVLALLIRAAHHRDLRVARELERRPLAPVIELGPAQLARERRRQCQRGDGYPDLDPEWNAWAREEFNRTGRWPA